MHLLQSDPCCRASRRRPPCGIRNCHGQGTALEALRAMGGFHTNNTLNSMLAIAPSIVALVFIMVPVMIVMVCVAIMRSEKRNGASPVLMALVALVAILFVLIYVAFAGCSAVGSG